jgi:hypothetical protein
VKRIRRQQLRPVSFWLIGLLIVVGPVGGLLWLLSHWPQQAADQIALVGVVATVVAVWLALLAAIVALMAYILADESPDLTVLLNGKPLANGFDLRLTGGTDGRYEITGPPELVFTLVNRSRFSARNPSIRVAFRDVWLHAFSPVWRVRSQTPDEIVLQWSGGADISVHGQWEEDAPPLGLVGNQSWARETVRMTIEVVAEGARLPLQLVPIRVQR